MSEHIPRKKGQSSNIPGPISGGGKIRTAGYGSDACKYKHLDERPQIPITLSSNLNYILIRNFALGSGPINLSF